MKQVQFPRGTTEEEDQILGAEGQVRVDLSRKELRMHDGVQLGGFRIPNEANVQAIVASGIEGQGGFLRVYATEAELIASTPNAQTIGVVTEGGLESFYCWKIGVGDQGSLPSAITGHWFRLDSARAEILRLWRAGLIYAELSGVEPIADQNKTIWVNGGDVLLWSGSEYVPATPELFCAVLAEIGGYSTSSFLLPDRLQGTAVTIGNANDITESGWRRGTNSTTNRPADVNFALQTLVLTSNLAVQIAYEIHATQTRVWLRYKVAGTWGSWATIEDLIGVLDESKIPAIPSSRVTGLDSALSGLTSGKADTVHTHVAGDVTSGTFDVARIPDLNANKITAGTLSTSRIPDLNASKITAGTLNEARIPSLDAGKITSGSFAAARIPNLNASKITAGTLPVARGGTGQTSEAGMRGVYTGTSGNNTSYPIGAIVGITATTGGSAGATNINQTLPIRAGSGHIWQGTSGSGTPIAGTWRTRMHYSGSTVPATIMQRVA